MAKTGRPPAIDDALMDKICERIAGGESLVRVCKSKGMPSYSTVMKHLSANPSFSEKYTRAREDQAETLADQIVDIADSETDPQRARVRVDARKWVASKLKPKKYGDRISTELSGPDGGPVKTEVDLASTLAFTLKKGLRVS